jgi:tRNA modification GTPase
MKQNNHSNSTIVALASPKGRGAVSIIRLSGNDSHKIAHKITRKDFFTSDRTLSWLYDENENKFDQALVLTFRKPHSFTGEDIVEFHCHGSPLIVQKLIKLCVFHGACLASPGEFSQRAFFNKKLDLTQAEAIMDLIQAKSLKFAQASANQLQGNFSEQIKNISNELSSILGLIHGPLDFPVESEFADIDEKSIFNKIIKLKSTIQRLSEKAHSSNILRQGLKTVILGRPNAGKSSLLNLLLDQERAIVSPEAGTTRDFITEEILIRDIPILLIDTAGLRHSTESHIEQEGIVRALKIAKDAELILFVFDSSLGWTDEDNKILSSIKLENKTAEIFLLANKSDIQTNTEIKKEIWKDDHKIILLSAKTSEGLASLEDAIESLAGTASLDGDFEIAINQRQAICLEEALLILQKIALETPAEIISYEVQEALHSLNKITGEHRQISDEAVSAIFANFCIGK